MYGNILTPKIPKYSSPFNLCLCVTLVIESLDQMKKGRENYSAREAIKFLEKELQGGNRFLQTQELHETMHPGAQKPHKQEMEIWYAALPIVMMEKLQDV